MLILKLYILLYTFFFFFLVKEKVGICILPTGMLLSKPDKHKC